MRAEAPEYDNVPCPHCKEYVDPDEIMEISGFARCGKCCEYCKGCGDQFRVEELGDSGLCGVCEKEIREWVKPWLSNG